MSRMMGETIVEGGRAQKGSKGRVFRKRGARVQKMTPHRVSSPEGQGDLHASTASPPAPLVPKLPGELSGPIGWSLPHRWKREGPARRGGGPCCHGFPNAVQFLTDPPPCRPAQRRQRETRLLSRWWDRRDAFTATQPTIAGNFLGSGGKVLRLVRGEEGGARIGCGAPP